MKRKKKKMKSWFFFFFGYFAEKKIHNFFFAGEERVILTFSSYNGKSWGSKGTGIRIYETIMAGNSKCRNVPSPAFERTSRKKKGNLGKKVDIE